MKNIRDLDLNGKKVIIRVDFNVPIKNGIITDDKRIIESLQTINYALDNNAKVILMSHLGRVESEEDKKKNDLSVVAVRLEELINKKVLFINKTRGKILENAVNNMKEKDIILIQNTRYEDLDGKKESKCDLELSKYWASLGDIFINDAFGTSHRAHASNVGIASILPSAVGFLVEKEINSMLPIINNPKHPFTVILGGSKVSDKIGVIENLIDKADNIIIGGAMAYTFLKAMGINIGNSKVEEDKIDYCKELLNKTDKISLPIDHVVSNIIGEQARIVDIIEPSDIAVDIGPKTIKKYQEIILKSKTVIWNGPMGMFEYDLYKKGTSELCKVFNKDIISIIGGGDTASAIKNMHYEGNFYHISTGGGASLELLEGKTMPGIEVIK